MPTARRHCAQCRVSQAAKARCGIILPCKSLRARDRDDAEQGACDCRLENRGLCEALWLKQFGYRTGHRRGRSSKLRCSQHQQQIKIIGGRLWKIDIQAKSTSRRDRCPLSDRRLVVSSGQHANGQTAMRGVGERFDVRVRGVAVLADLREKDHRSAGEVASERGALSSSPIVMS
jgi:hypothetical protein